MFMLRRTPAGVLIALLLLVGVAPAGAASREELDARVREALQTLYKTSSAAHDLAQKSTGILVFPRILKGGFVVGGEYGEGALLVGGKAADYYAIASASLGLQAGIQRESVVILFMDAAALKRFRDSHGWKAGVDGSVALATLGTGEAVDTETMRSPIIGFVYSNQGLMANLTLEGSKITRLRR